MVPKFTYNDIVRVKGAAQAPGGQLGWIVGVFEERAGTYFDKFAPGVVYTVEFEDGSATELHENKLEPATIQEGEQATRAKSAG
ncbi:hypothetical protein GCM10027318_18410 [Massilia agilis]